MWQESVFTCRKALLLQALDREDTTVMYTDYQYATKLHAV